jgi:Flp pilus assembly protein TadD
MMYYSTKFLAFLRVFVVRTPWIVGRHWKWLLGLSVAGLLAGAVIFHFNARDRRGPDIPGNRSSEPRLQIGGTDAGYIDSAVCAACHPRIYQTYQQTGMGRSFSRPRAANIVENFGKTFYHPVSDRNYTMVQRDGKYYQRRHQIDFDGKETNVVEKEIHFVVGSGNHARTYLHRTEDGKVVELPVAWYSEKGGRWGMNPGYDRPDHQDFRRRITFGCMFCHNGYPAIAPGSDASGTEPVFSGEIREGIDCQRCHGPGRSHTQAAQAQDATAETIRRSIVNPARLDPERRLEVCLQCHLESTSFRLPYSITRYDRGVFSYRPGEPLGGYILHFDHAQGTGHDDKFEIAHQAYRLRKSACFQKSAGSLTCTTCHDPHDVPRGESATRHYVGVCQRCHGAPLEKLAASGRHSQSRDCLGCHMPKRRTEDVVHVVMTDHYIQRRKPAVDLLAPLEERRETEQTGYRGEVVLYYPPQLTSVADRELYVAVAQVKQKSNLQKGVALLEAAIEKHRPEQPEFYFDLAEAYSESGQDEKAISLYHQALRLKPDFRPALHRLGVALAKSGQLPRAAEVLESATRLTPVDATMLNDLGLVYRRQGRVADAVAAFQKVVNLDPDMPQAYNNLGGSLSELGDRAAAETAFRAAIRVQPDFGAAHTNLANLIAARGDFRAAEYHFEKAIQIDPKYAAARYDYALVLGQREMFEKARGQLEEAVRLDPDRADAHNALGDMLAIAGKTEDAIRHYRRAIQLSPELAVAHFNLGAALASQGKKREAEQHFRRAAELKQIQPRSR